MESIVKGGTKWTLVRIVLLGFCLLANEVVDAHILVYRRLTNQVLVLIEEYNDLPAQFGPSLPSNGLKVFAIPVHPSEYGCDHIDNPPSHQYPSKAKFVALIQRGGTDCTFEKKVRNAQEARFDAVIVYNNKSDDLEHMSAENSSGIMIPSVFVGHTAGVNLKSFYSSEIVLVINDELPFNINTQLILPFSILIGLCFLIMIFYMIYKCIREERRLRRYRLPKRMLKKLPILKYTKNSDLAYDTCVICLDDFAEGDKLRVLPCRHPYHSHCIDVWLTENKRDCPICKRKVFTKGEARSQRNRQSSLDSITDTDDDTTPLLQQSNNTLATTTTASSTGSVARGAAVAADAATTRHGTFRRNAVSGGGGAGGGDVTSDDENMLVSQQSSPARRINPFDRAPNLPPHLAAQLSSETNRRSIWSWPILRLFRRREGLSIAAPPYLDEVLNDVVAAATAAAAVAEGSSTIQSSAAPLTPHSSNNILNPNLSGSFTDCNGADGDGDGDNDDDDDDDAPLQCIYEPIAVITPTTTTSLHQPEIAATGRRNNSANNVIDASAANSTSDRDSVFIQTPTQGGIGVAALPNNSDNALTGIAHQGQFIV